MKRTILLVIIAAAFALSNAFSEDQEIWITQDWVEDDWENTFRDIINYENDLMVLLLYQQWIDSEWVNKTRFKHEYDSEGREISYMIQFHDDEGWYDYTKEEYFYEDDKFVKFVRWYGGENHEPLEIDSEIIYYYNENDLLEKSEVFRWDLEEKILYEAEYYQYDDHNREIERIIKKFDFVLDDLMNNFRQTRSYEGELSLPSIVIDQKWENDDWVNIQQSIYTYDDDGLWIEHISQYWTNDWHNTTKVTLERNDNKQELQRTTQIWNEDTWVNTIRTLSEYNDEDILIRRLEQKYSEDDWFNDIEHLYYFRDQTRYLIINRIWIEDLWVNDTRTYLDGWLGAKGTEIPNLNLSIYPNPAYSNIDINFTLNEMQYIDATIFSIDGKSKLEIANSTMLPGQINIVQDISNLQSGSYILHLRIGNERLVKKFVISR